MNRGKCPALSCLLLNKQMIVRHYRQLRQMGNAQHLLIFRHTFELYSYFLRRTSADACIYLIKNKGVDIVLFGDNVFQRQHYS